MTPPASLAIWTARMISGPIIKMPTTRVSRIAVIDGIIPLQTSHWRTGHVATARTPAHARAGKKRRRIQTAERTNIATRMIRPNDCRDDDCCSIKRPPLRSLTSRHESSQAHFARHCFHRHGDRVLKLTGGLRAKTLHFYPPPFAGSTAQIPGVTLVLKRASGREGKRLSNCLPGAAQY